MFFVQDYLFPPDSLKMMIEKRLDLSSASVEKNDLFS